MTLAELRARLRAELGDQTVGAYVWSDELLDGFLGDAVERLGADSPLQREAQLSTAADGAYALPADRLRLHEALLDDTPLHPAEYTVWAGKLRLQSPSPSELLVRYAAARGRPPATGDVGLRAGEDPPVIWLAASYAMEWLSKQREKTGSALAATSGTVAQAYEQRYETWLATKPRPLRRTVMSNG
ncbi:MAG: hypothetical protein M3Q29_11455 [Chloroflexota bacterium]|nr:hypothetical protein [Chloroflexota bacterium]